MIESTVACRLHVLLASDADIGVVFRRGPAAWWHILKWDLKQATLESGAWCKGSLYPTRAGVSCDGKVLAYFALHGRWGTYLALSKPPWLRALCAWHTVGTWTTGAYFQRDGTLCAYGALCEEQPFHGHCPFPYQFGGVDTNWNRAREFQFLRNGWKPKVTDAAMMNFNPGPHEIIELTKCSPSDPEWVLNRYSEFGSCLYTMTYQDHPENLLSEAVWADFDRRGRLVMASATGELTLYEPSGATMTKTFSHNLNSLKPNPIPAPVWARQW